MKGTPETLLFWKTTLVLKRRQYQAGNCDADRAVFIAGNQTLQLKGK